MWNMLVNLGFVSSGLGVRSTRSLWVLFGLGFALVVVCWAWPKRSPAEPKAERLGRSEGEGQQTAKERPFTNSPALVRHFISPLMRVRGRLRNMLATELRWVTKSTPRKDNASLG